MNAALYGNDLSMMDTFRSIPRKIRSTMKPYFSKIENINI